jgi:hypothetical protein
MERRGLMAGEGENHLRPLQNFNLDLIIPAVANSILVGSQTQVSDVSISPVLHTTDLLD